MGLLGRLNGSASSAVAPLPDGGGGPLESSSNTQQDAQSGMRGGKGQSQTQSAQRTDGTSEGEGSGDPKLEEEKDAFHKHMQLLYELGKMENEQDRWSRGWRGKVSKCKDLAVSLKRRVLCQRDPSKGPTPKKKWSPFRQFISQLVHNIHFSNFIFFVIFLNSVLFTLQMEESTNLVWAYYLSVFDNILMAIYILELAMKLFALQERFLLSGWNIFDAVIVFISILETLLYTVLNNTSNLSPAIFRLFRIFKALKAMRALRALSFLKNLQVIVSTLLKSIPAMGSIILLLMLILYIFAIIFVILYKDILPNHFGSLWLAMFSLFQLITLDDWSEYYYLVKRSPEPQMATGIMIYMSIFIVLETFICINLFIAVIVNNLERANMRERQRRKRKLDDELNQEQNKALQDKKKKGRRNRRGRHKKDRDHDNASAQEDQGQKEDPEGATGAATDAKKSGSAAAAPLKTKQNNPSSRKKKSHDSDDDDNDSQDEDPFMVGKKAPSEAFINDPSVPLWQRELQPEILTLIASLDHNMNILFRHQRTLDELVDATASPITKIKSLEKKDKNA